MVRPVGPMLEYVIHEDYIAEFLCINKEKAELNCNGKCYLMQRLAEQDEQKKQNIPKIALEEYPIGFVEFFIFSAKRNTSYQNLILKNYINCYSFLFSYSNFHPPNTLA